MGRLFVEELEGRSYSCKHCGTHLALHGDIISKAFSLISCCFWFVIEFVAQSVFSSSCYLSFTKRLASKMLYPISLSTAGMGKLISSGRCKFFLILGMGHLLYMLVKSGANSMLEQSYCQSLKMLFEHTVLIYLPSGPLLVNIRLAEPGRVGWKGSGELRSWKTKMASNCLFSLCHYILSITEQSKRDLYHDGLPADLNRLTLYGRVNVFAGEKEDRSMITGLHTVADIFCVGCGSIVGWKYETAHDKSQKYKEGKSVLERFKLSGPDGSHYWVHEHHHISGSDADDV
ncbi:hypothetical protein DKX38_016238 [Salix brachista]|uniref:Yippee domain-containing protein n=1 Tax=Salix brachista TaxID=2182728 RepID=A0A5N5L7F2_9ROSI|nr:hypothetical protein DKX38_016238 [Salix brachista]